MLELCRQAPSCLDAVGTGLRLHEAIADLGGDVVDHACSRFFFLAQQQQAKGWSSSATILPSVTAICGGQHCASKTCVARQRQTHAPGVCGRNTDDAREDTPMSLSMSKYWVIIIICRARAVSAGSLSSGRACPGRQHNAHLDDVPAADVGHVACTQQPATSAQPERLPAAAGADSCPMQVRCQWQT